MLDPVVGGEVAVHQGDHRRHRADRLDQRPRAAPRPAPAGAAAAVTARVAATAARTRQSSNGSRAAGRRRRASGSTAIASASFSGPRRPGHPRDQPRRQLRLALGGDLDLAVGVADRRRPVGRPVDQQAVAQRHPAEPQLAAGLVSHALTIGDLRCPTVDLLLVADRRSPWRSPVASPASCWATCAAPPRPPVSSSTSAGAGANVAISAALGADGPIAHLARGRIDWRLFWLMAPPSLLGGIVGGRPPGSAGTAAARRDRGASSIAGGADPALGGRRPRAEPTARRASRPRSRRLRVVPRRPVGRSSAPCGCRRWAASWDASPKRRRSVTNAATGVVVGVGGLIARSPAPAEIDVGSAAAGCAGAVPGAYFGAHLTGASTTRPCCGRSRSSSSSPASRSRPGDLLLRGLARPPQREGAEASPLGALSPLASTRPEAPSPGLRPVCRLSLALAWKADPRNTGDCGEVAPAVLGLAEPLSRSSARRRPSSASKPRSVGA